MLKIISDCPSVRIDNAGTHFYHESDHFIFGWSVQYVNAGIERQMDMIILYQVWRLGFTHIITEFGLNSKAVSVCVTV